MNRIPLVQDIIRLTQWQNFIYSLILYITGDRIKTVMKSSVIK